MSKNKNNSPDQEQESGGLSVFGIKTYNSDEEEKEQKKLLK